MALPVFAFNKALDSAFALGRNNENKRTVGNHAFLAARCAAGYCLGERCGPMQIMAWARDNVAMGT